MAKAPEKLPGSGRRHCFRTPDSPGSMAERGETLNGSTSLPQFTQFSHSADTIFGFMLILQNAFAGLLLAFTAVLLAVMYAVIALVVLVVVSMTTGRLLSVERRDLGLTRAMGFSAGRLRRSFALRFALVSLIGAALGTLASVILSDPIVAKFMASCGISGFAARPDLGAVLLPGIIVTALFTFFAWLSAQSIRAIDLPELFTE